MNPFVVFPVSILNPLALEFETNQVKLQLTNQYLQLQLFKTKISPVFSGLSMARQSVPVGVVQFLDYFQLNK